MELSWKDAVATGLAGAVAAVYVAFLNGTGAWLISSARGSALAITVLGIAGCSLGTPGDVYRRGRPAASLAYGAAATTIGVLALASAVIAMVSGSVEVLTVLAGATLALWLMSTVRHAFTAPGQPARGREEHEVIHQEKTPPR